MAASASTPARWEQLTDEFYRWEVRGRGWQVWPYPVPLEPPFRPFLFHGAAGAPQPRIDDGRKPTFFGALVSRLLNREDRPPLAPAIAANVEEDDDIPDLAPADEDLAILQLVLPRDHDVRRDAAEQLLVGLAACTRPLSFELVGDGARIVVQLVCRSVDEHRVAAAVAAYFPSATLRRDGDALAAAVLRTAEESRCAVSDLGLASEFMRPLAITKTFAVDPLIAITTALGGLQQGEVGTLQVLFEAAHAPWAESVLRAVSDQADGSFFADAPDMLRLAREKIARPLVAAVIRAAAWSSTPGRATLIVRDIAAGLRVLANPPSNDLVPLDDEGYDSDEHLADVIARQTRRSGMLLSTEELAGLVHLPSPSVQHPRLVREVARTKAAPDLARGHELVLGENTHQGRTVEVTLNSAHRIRHTYVVGASGTGKSTLLLSMILQDIEQGRGCAVLDPHGDLVDSVLARVPERRHPDIVLFDPSDEDWPVGFNVLQAHSELERNLLSSDLVAVFRRFSTSWGDQMTAVLGNALLAFLESERGGTLVDLRRFLVEADFRRSFLATVRDPQVVYYFEREYPLLKGSPAASILTRLDAFLRPKLVRYMVAQRDDRLEFRAIIDTGKVFLAKLSQGAIGEENAHLLGSLLVSRFHQVALSRQDRAERDRPDFFLYLDEFHHLVTPSLASILSGARKYHLGLVLAHQELRQLSERDPALADAVLTNPATRVCFRLGDLDAKRLADGFASFDGSDLQNLGVGDAVCRIERADYDFTLRTHPVASVDDATAERTRDLILRHSRETYARPRETVERDLHEAHAPLLHRATPMEGRPPPSATRDTTVSNRTPTSPPAPPRAPLGDPAPPPATSQGRRPEPHSPLPPVPGRGGTEHKYLQHLVKRLAEARGWKATIEAPVLGGAGSVDVSLERDDRRLAVEVSISTPVDHELENVQKCLAAGYESVLVVVRGKRALRTLAQRIQDCFEEEARKRVIVLAPESLVDVLDCESTTHTAREATVRGYKVTVQHSPTQAADTALRKQAISKILLRSLKPPHSPEPPH